jgi:pimeloyl-ACP methyl ester carboxylesterase
MAPPRALLLALLLLPAASSAAPPCAVVDVPTSDGLTLHADHCPAGVERAPVVILLHMIPPRFDRTNYPSAFRAALQDAGFTVLNLDRRGAGASGGNAEDAYMGPKGRLDVAAARAWLAAHDPAADLGRWACAGASNGTTSCLDYAAWAKAEEPASVPRALVFLTGGSYTENNTALKGSVAASLPVLFTFNEEEKAWSEAQRGGGEGWVFRSYAPGGHGTKAFAPNPEAMKDVADFLARSLAKP